MNPENLQRVYLKYLYIEHFAGDGSRESDYLSRHMDMSRLVIERKARQRNLRTSLINSSRFIRYVFDKEQMLEMVIRYISSDSLWEAGKGRTLFEDFCFYIYENYEFEDAKAQLFRLDGIGSAHSSIRGAKSSPWCSKQVGDREIFRSNVCYELKTFGSSDFSNSYKLGDFEYEIYYDNEKVKISIKEIKN